MEPEEGVPLWRLQKLPAELGLQVRRAPGAAARGRAPGRPGVRGRSHLDAFAGLAPASQGKEEEGV